MEAASQLRMAIRSFGVAEGQARGTPVVDALSNLQYLCSADFSPEELYPPLLPAVRIMFAQALVRSDQLTAASQLFDHMIRLAPDSTFHLQMVHAHALLDSVRG